MYRRNGILENSQWAILQLNIIDINAIDNHLKILIFGFCTVQITCIYLYYDDSLIDKLVRSRDVFRIGVNGIGRYVDPTVPEFSSGQMNISFSLCHLYLEDIDLSSVSLFHNYLVTYDVKTYIVVYMTCKIMRWPMINL